MFKNSSKLMFLMCLMMGTLISISANSWLGAWMGLEINLLSFIPLMNDMNNLMSTEASLKYFLTQAIASVMLMFFVIMLSIKNNMVFQFSNNYIDMLIMSTLFLKSGSAPFHFWFPGVMEGLSWVNNLILMTWQKLAPLALISYLNNSYLMYLAIFSSIMTGSLGGLNQTSMKKIMAFSSINHIGWMLSAMLFSENTWMIYFILYSLLSLIMILILHMEQIYHINQFFISFNSSKMKKFFLSTNLLSLGGLPPFLGFLPKWVVIQTLVENNQLFLMTMMTMMTLITLFFYLRLCYTAFMFNHAETSWSCKNYTEKYNFHIMTLSLTSMFGLLVISSLYFML